MILMAALVGLLAPGAIADESKADRKLAKEALLLSGSSCVAHCGTTSRGM